MFYSSILNFVKEIYDIAGARNKLINDYIITLLSCLIVYTIGSIMVVFNLTVFILFLLCIISVLIVIKYQLLLVNWVVYVFLITLISFVFYFAINRDLSFLTIFYVTIGLSIISIFDKVSDLYRVLSLFSLIAIAVFIIHFTKYFDSGIDFTEGQKNAMFALTLVAFSVFSIIHVSFLRRRRFVLDWYLNEYNRMIHAKDEVADQASLEQVNKLKEELYEGHTGFLNHFQQVFPIFYSRLKRMEHISKSEIEILALTKLQYNTYEIAQILNTTSKSIESKKYRIRKKYNIPTSEDFYVWVDNI